MDGRGSSDGDRRVVVKITDWGLGSSDVMCEDWECGSRPYMAYGKPLLFLLVRPFWKAHESSPLNQNVETTYDHRTTHNRLTSGPSGSSSSIYSTTGAPGQILPPKTPTSWPSEKTPSLSSRTASKVSEIPWLVSSPNMFSAMS